MLVCVIKEMHQAILILEGPGPTKYLTLVGQPFFFFFGSD